MANVIFLVVYEEAYEYQSVQAAFTDKQAACDYVEARYPDAIRDGEDYWSLTRTVDITIEEIELDPKITEQNG